MPIPLEPPVSVPVGPTGRSFYVEEPPKKRPDSTLEQDALDAVPLDSFELSDEYFKQLKLKAPPIYGPHTAYIGPAPSPAERFSGWFSQNFWPKISENPLTTNPLKTLGRRAVAVPALIGAAYRSFNPQPAMPDPTAFSRGLENTTEPWKVAETLDRLAPPTLFEPGEQGMLPGIELGVRENIKGAKDFMLSDAGLMASGAAMTPAAPVAAAAFAIDMLSKVPDLAMSVFDAKTSTEEGRALANTGATAAFGLGAAGHSAKAAPARGTAAKNPVPTELEALKADREKVFDAQILAEEAKARGPQPENVKAKLFPGESPISERDALRYRDRVATEFDKKYGGGEADRILRDAEIDGATVNYRGEGMIGPRDLEIGEKAPPVVPEPAKTPQEPPAPITEVKNLSELNKIINDPYVKKAEAEERLNRKAESVASKIQDRIDIYNAEAAQTGKPQIAIPIERIAEMYKEKVTKVPELNDGDLFLDMPEFRREALLKESQALLSQQKSGSEGIIADSKLPEQEKVIQQGEARLAQKTGVTRPPMTEVEAKRAEEFAPVLAGEKVKEPSSVVTGEQSLLTKPAESFTAGKREVNVKKNPLEGFDPAKDIDFSALYPDNPKLAGEKAVSYQETRNQVIKENAGQLVKMSPDARRAEIDRISRERFIKKELVVPPASDVGRNIRERGTKLYTGGEIAFAIDKFKDMIRNGRAYPIRLSEKAREKYNLGEAVVDAKTGEVFHPGNESIKLDLLPEDKIPWYEGERTKGLFDGMREAADKGFEQRPKIQQELPLPESEIKSPSKQDTGDRLFSNPLADPEQLKKMVRLNVVGKHDKDTWFGTLQARIAPDEMAIYKEAGLEKFLSEGGKRSVEEVRDWMQENGPKVEVKSYGMDGNASPERIEYDKLRHEWFDNLDGGSQQTIFLALGRIGDKALVEKELSNLSGKNYELAKRYVELDEKLRSEIPDTSPRATSAYKEVSPFNVLEPMPDWTVSKAPKNVQRVDVVMPKKSSADLREDALAGRKQIKTPTLWSPDNLHENLPNTLGWAMVQYRTRWLNRETGEVSLVKPVNEQAPGWQKQKIAFLAEGQSRWGQSRRENVKQIAEEVAKDVGQVPDSIYAPPDIRKLKAAGIDTSKPITKDSVNSVSSAIATATPDHPLLKDYNRLILKAAIRQARKEGADHIFISDAETAMMTEKLDSPSWRVVDEKTGEILQDGFGDKQTANQGSKNNPGTRVEEYLEREGGFRLNYDKGLPKIAEELLGKEGEVVSLGEHKNAFTVDEGKQYISRPVSGNELQQYIDSAKWTEKPIVEDLGNNRFKVSGYVYYPKKSRDNLIFKNKDGTPKTDVTGKLFDISDISPDHKWTQFRRDKAGSAPQEGLLFSGPGFLFTEKFWKEFGERRGAPVFRSITDRIHNETKDIPGGPEVEAGLRYRMAQERQIRNRWISDLQNRVLGEDSTANGIKRLASFFKNEKEQETVGEYLYKKRAGMKPAALSDPVLQKIADSVTDLYFDSTGWANQLGIKNIAGETLTQYPKSKGYYPWDMMKENFNNVLRTGKPAPDFNRVKKSVIDHWLKVEPRLSKATAEKEFSDYLQMLRSGTGSFDRSADFNALRKFSGRGLPLELVDTNVLRTGEKYFHRYAKDMSWERMKQQVPGIDYVLGENNAPTPDIQAKFGQLKEQAGDVYKDWLETEFNPRQSKFGDVGQAANRLGANLLISAAAPLRDVVQLMQDIPTKVGVSDLPMAMKALANHKQGIELAQKSGVYGRTFTHLKDAALNPSQAGKAVRVMDSMSIFLRKLRGRDLKDKKEAGYLASLADVFVQSEVLKARAGEKEAIQNIRNIGEGVTGGVDALLKSKEPIPTEQHLELIHGFVESVRGKYDARSQPRWAIDGWTAPFFSLARWSIGKTNQFRNELLNPATKGNWKPLLRYTLGGIVAGSVINELNELLNQKRRESPTVGEAFKEGDDSEKIIAILDNLSLAGYGGLASSLASAGMEAVVEKDARAAGNKLFIGAPALEIGYTIRDAVVDVINNSKSDMDLVEGLAQIGASTTEAIFGEARILNRNLFNTEEAEEKSDSRDVRAWEDLRDFPAAPKAEIQNAPPADEGAKELRRKYGQKKKLTPDESRQFKADFEAYADELRASALGQDPEKVYNKLEALKSAQIYPSIPSGKTISGKAKSDDFVDFIENTQGKEEAADIESKIKTNLHHEGYDARLDAFIKGYMAKHYKMNTKMFNKKVR